MILNYRVIKNLLVCQLWAWWVWWDGEVRLLESVTVSWICLVVPLRLAWWMKRIEVGCDQNSLQSETAILFYSKPKSEHGRLQLSVGQISLSRLSDSETVNQACTHIDGRNFKIIGCIEMHTGVQTFSLRELPISSCPRPRQQWPTVTKSDSDSQLQIERHCEALWASWLISWFSSLSSKLLATCQWSHWFSVLVTCQLTSPWQECQIINKFLCIWSLGTPRIHMILCMIS